MTPYVRGYSASRSSRSLDRFMILACAIFVFALCANYTAAAQNPNLLEQMEGDFNELSNKAVSWSMYPATDTDTMAQNEYDIGLWSDSACWELTPEQGYIEILEQYLPQEIPLCIDQAVLDQWGVYVHVYGGYELLETHLWLYQKNYDWQEVIVKVTPVPGACCSDYYYKINFTLPADVDHICFDANNFPDATGWSPFEVGVPDGNELEKEIYAYFCSLWSGCIEPTQEFTISLVQPNCRHFELCVTSSLTY